MTTEHFTHHADQPQRAIIAHAIKHPVGIFAGGEDTFITQDRKVLGDVALRCPDLIDNILHAYLLVAQGAQDLEPQRMRHGLERA